MGSLADLYGFQAMSWVYIDAAMQQYAILRPGSDSSVLLRGPFLPQMGRQYRGVFATLSSGRECVLGSLADLYGIIPSHDMGVY
jgi:hypothetical protein